jgi:uncharacterized membrane protein
MEVYMAKVVMAAFRDSDTANNAVVALEEKGYDSHDLSVISKENKSEANDVIANTTEGAASGATTGAAVGGLTGLLAGAGIIPAIAGLFIGGPIAAVLGATGIAATTISGAVTGAAAGGLLGALMGLGVSEDVARSYETTVNEGGIILAVPVRDSDNESPRLTLEELGAHDVSEVELKG